MILSSVLVKKQTKLRSKTTKDKNRNDKIGQCLYHVMSYVGGKDGYFVKVTRDTSRLRLLKLLVNFELFYHVFIILKNESKYAALYHYFFKACSLHRNHKAVIQNLLLTRCLFRYFKIRR